jgi:hypothetical protein
MPFQIDAIDDLVGHDHVWLADREASALVEDCHAGSETECHFHVVLDDYDREFLALPDLAKAARDVTRFI